MMFFSILILSIWSKFLLKRSMMPTCMDLLIIIKFILIIFLRFLNNFKENQNLVGVEKLRGLCFFGCLDFSL